MNEHMRTLYKRVESLPVVGGAFKRLKSFLHPYVERHRLHHRDLVAAHLFIDTHLEASRALHDDLERFRKSPLFTAQYGHGHSGDYDIMVLYITVRYLQPEVVVETGVASGRSSGAILQALKENGKGRLFSVDLAEFYEGEAPEYYQNQHGVSELKGYIPKDKKVGWMVPEELRSRWELVIGDSNVELEKIFDQYPSVDMFYHDSDHSYETMTHEFSLAWPRVREGGFLFADDISWNDAWKEFLVGKPETNIYVYRRFGIIKK